MQRKADDHKDHEQLRGCFYRGRVRSDDRSTVAVSLCDGMVSVDFGLQSLRFQFM